MLGDATKETHSQEDTHSYTEPPPPVPLVANRSFLFLTLREGAGGCLFIIREGDCQLCCAHTHAYTGTRTHSHTNTDSHMLHQVASLPARITLERQTHEKPSSGEPHTARQNYSTAVCLGVCVFSPIYFLINPYQQELSLSLVTCLLIIFKLTIYLLFFIYFHSLFWQNKSFVMCYGCLFVVVGGNTGTLSPSHLPFNPFNSMFI